jgi:ribonuclease T2
VLLLTAVPAFAQQAKPAEFESLVLSLSWSPTWCTSKAGHSDADQCGPGKKFGLVMQGLVGRYARGTPHPRKCLTATEVPAKVADQMASIMPSRKLMERDWEKHGACMDRDPAGYFAKAKAAYDKVKIPAAFRSADQPRTMSADQIRKAFVDANPGLPGEAIAVTCKKKKKGEAEAADKSGNLCFDKDLKFGACSGSVRDRCPPSINLPAMK